MDINCASNDTKEQWSHLQCSSPFPPDHREVPDGQTEKSLNGPFDHGINAFDGSHAFTGRANCVQNSNSNSVRDLPHSEQAIHCRPIPFSPR